MNTLQPVDFILLDAAKRAYSESTFDSEWAHLLLIGDEHSLIGAHRGTDPHKLTDWHVDASMGRTVAPFGVVHQEFYRSCCSVLLYAVPRIIEARRAGKHIYWTGHSKGGSEARLAGGVLKWLGLTPDRVSGFEAARCMAPSAAQYVADIDGVWTHYGADEVPTMPPWFEAAPELCFGDTAFRLDWVERYHSLDAVAAALIAIGSGNAVQPGSAGG